MLTNSDNIITATRASAWSVSGAPDSGTLVIILTTIQRGFYDYTSVDVTNLNIPLLYVSQDVLYYCHNSSTAKRSLLELSTQPTALVIYDSFACKNTLSAVEETHSRDI